MLAWNLAAAPGLLAAPLFLGAALSVFLARPGRRQNRLLAAFFAWSALYALATGLALTVQDAASAYALTIVGTLGVVLMHAGYLLFLGTLPTPIVGWLRLRPVRTAMVLGFAAVAATVLVFPSRWHVDMVPGRGDVPWVSVLGPAWVPFDAFSIVLLVFAVVVAVSAFRRARGPMARRQTGAYLTGFAVFDATIAIMLAVALAGIPLRGELFFGAWFYWGILLAALWLVGALTYGVLAAQLFDIDLKIKWTIKQSTIALVFVAVFLAATEGAQVVFGADNPWIGIAAAVLLVFALAPLQRLAERVSQAALPGVADTDAYRTVRKREVYRAAIESALLDGEITTRERDVLATLADELGLSAGDARAIEREATAGGVT